MTKQEAQSRLAEIVRDARDKHDAALNQCIAFADKHGLMFEWNEEYGASHQKYYGAGATVPDQWDSSTDDYGDVVIDEGKWTSSSDNC